MSDLLKESIADAKAVRETALANAKTFLEESYANSMKEMFADKLKEEMAEEGDEEEGKIEEKLASSNIGKNDGLTAKTSKPSNPSALKSTTSNGKQEFDVKLEEDASSDDGDEVTSEELDEILAELEGDVSDEMHNQDPSETPVTGADMGEGDDINLDELLAELEAEDAAAPVPAPAPAPVTPDAQAPADQVPAVPAPAPAPAQVPSPSEGE